jgi:hypothetical protein
MIKTLVESFYQRKKIKFMMVLFKFIFISLIFVLLIGEIIAFSKSLKSYIIVYNDGEIIRLNVEDIENLFQNQLELNLFKQNHESNVPQLYDNNEVPFENYPHLYENKVENSYIYHTKDFYYPIQCGEKYGLQRIFKGFNHVFNSLNIFYFFINNSKDFHLSQRTFDYKF